MNHMLDFDYIMDENVWRIYQWCLYFRKQWLESRFELNMSSKCDWVAKKTVIILHLKEGNYWAEDMVLSRDGL